MGEADPMSPFDQLAADKQADEDLNLQWRVARAPVGNVRSDDFEWAAHPIPEPRDGEVLLKTLYLSLAPVMRAYMQGKPAAGETPLSPGDVIHGRGVAQVSKSRHTDWKEGEVVQGQIGWQTWKVSAMTPGEKMFRMQPNGLSAALGLGILGMTGLSAYAGYFACGDPEPEDRMLLSGAAGGVGSIVAQLAAKVVGSDVVGIAGGAEKCAFVRSLGCSGAIDYLAGDIAASIAAARPDGVDLYFDNVGGETLAATLEHLRARARIVLCGSISEYARETPFALANYTRLRATDSSMRGFFVYNHLGLWDEAMEAMSGWIGDGRLTPHFDIIEGSRICRRRSPPSIRAGNIGKQICRVRGEPEGWQ
jgi:NADPH-dependent curcumin reductase CurA